MAWDVLELNILSLFMEESSIRILVKEMTNFTLTHRDVSDKRTRKMKVQVYDSSFVLLSNSFPFDLTLFRHPSAKRRFRCFRLTSEI
jgi:hypothetical protein